MSYDKKDLRRSIDKANLCKNKVAFFRLKVQLMVLILDGNSEVVAYVWNDLGHLICQRHLLTFPGLWNSWPPIYGSWRFLPPPNTIKKFYIIAQKSYGF